MAGKRAALSAERIEIEALDLIEREGLDKFSTRKLATALGCEAMSIYHYFPSKAHLMDALLDRMLSTIEWPAPDTVWRERLRQSLLAYRAMAHRYPRFFQFAALHRHNTRRGLSVLERLLEQIREAGFDDETTARIFRALGYYVSGAALDETSGYAKGPSAVEPVSDADVARDFPLVAAVNPYFKPDNLQATFDLGLDILLDGIEVMAEDARKKQKMTG